jgi:large subunit ribosomal protein L7Ae
MPKKGSKKKAAAPAPVAAKKEDPLHPNAPRNMRIGGAVRPARDVGRFVRWPKYIRIQRQRRVIMQRLKIPAVINQFTKSLNKNQATELFKLLNNYKPETKDEKKARLQAMAADKAAGGDGKGSAPGATLKFGLKHVTTLVEQKKAKLVVIAHDVNPVELVLWLPALCRKMDVPYCIVKGKGRLGQMVHKKNSAVLALTSVNGSDNAKLSALADDFKAQYNDNSDNWRKMGGGIMGLKTVKKLEIRARAMEIEAAKKAQY